MKKRALWIVAAIIVIGGGAALLLSRGGEDMLEVQTATVGLETIVQKVNATGRIQPKTQVRISADVSAKIMRLHVEEGDSVEEGQLLVELNGSAMRPPWKVPRLTFARHRPTVSSSGKT